MKYVAYCSTMDMGGTGEMRLATASLSENMENRAAESNLAASLMQQGRCAEAEPKLRELHGQLIRFLGAEHPDTLAAADNLAESLSRQGKYLEVERIQRELLDSRKLVLGAEHPIRLRVQGNLAASLSRQGKYAEAEQIQREMLGVQKRMLGAEHPETLACANLLATTLACALLDHRARSPNIPHPLLCCREEDRKAVTCPLCFMLLVEPVIFNNGDGSILNCNKDGSANESALPCGDGPYCGACARRHLQISPACPACQRPTKPEQIVDDTRMQRAVRSALVRCAFYAEGCEWKGEVRDFSAHQGTCPQLARTRARTAARGL